MRTKDQLAVSLSLFARLLDMDKSYLSRLTKKGRLEKDNDKYLLSNKINIDFIKSRGLTLEDLLTSPLLNEDTTKKTKNKTVKHSKSLESPQVSQQESTGNENDTDGSFLDKHVAEVRLIRERERKLRIENEKTIGNLIDKELIKSILGHIGQSIQTAFIDLGRREANNISAQLGIPQKEREIEKMLNDLSATGIENVIADCESFLNLIEEGNINEKHE